MIKLLLNKTKKKDKKKKKKNYVLINQIKNKQRPVDKKFKRKKIQIAKNLSKNIKKNLIYINKNKLFVDHKNINFLQILEMKKTTKKVKTINSSYKFLTKKLKIKLNKQKYIKQFKSKKIKKAKKTYLKLFSKKFTFIKNNKKSLNKNLKAYKKSVLNLWMKKNLRKIRSTKFFNKKIKQKQNWFLLEKRIKYKPNLKNNKQIRKFKLLKTNFVRKRFFKVRYRKPKFIFRKKKRKFKFKLNHKYKAWKKLNQIKFFKKRKNKKGKKNLFKKLLLNVPKVNLFEWQKLKEKERNQEIEMQKLYSMFPKYKINLEKPKIHPIYEFNCSNNHWILNILN